MKRDAIIRKMRVWADSYPAVWFFAGLAVILFVVSAHPFPDGYRFVSGDIAEPSDVASRYDELVSGTDGRGMLWYGLFFLFDQIGLSDGGTLSAHFFLFLVGAFVSFRWFLRKLFPDIPEPSGTLLSLIYALNTLTLSFFVSGWMFSPALVLYPFLPALTASFLLSLRDASIRESGIFLTLFFFATTTFVHPETIVSMFIFFGLLTVFAFTFGWARIRLRALLALGALGTFAVALSAYALPSAIIMIRHGEASTLSESFLGLGWYLRYGGAPVMEALRLLPYDFLSHFPSWFPYEALHGFSPLFLTLTLLPLVGIVLALLVRKPDQRHKHLFFIGLSVLLVFVILVAKARPPFIGINGSIFSLPGMGSLRAPERLMLFLPFIILLTVISSRLIHKYRSVMCPVLLLLLLTPIPFFMGDIHTRWSPLFEDDYAPNRYEQATESPLVQIPDEYREIAEYLRESDPDASVARLPFTGKHEHPGWEYAPEWGHVGADILPEHFSGTLISANRPYADDFLYARYFGLSDEDPAWILPFFRTAGIRYLLLDLTAPDNAKEGAEKRLDTLEHRGSIERLRETEVARLYRVTDPVFPEMLIAEEDIAISGRPVKDRMLVGATETIAYRAPEWKTEGKGYVLEVNREDSGKLLAITEPFSPHYGAVLVDADGVETGLWHVSAFGFQNGWKLPDRIDDGATVRIVYYPERFVGIARTVSLVTLLCVIIGVTAYMFYERHKR